MVIVTSEINWWDRYFFPIFLKFLNLIILWSDFTQQLKRTLTNIIIEYIEFYIMVDFVIEIELGSWIPKMAAIVRPGNTSFVSVIFNDIVLTVNRYHKCIIRYANKLKLYAIDLTCYRFTQNTIGQLWLETNFLSMFWVL